MARNKKAAKKDKKESAPRERRTKKAEVNVIDEVEEVKGGLGLEDGIAITTFLCLVGALALVLIASGRYPS